MLGHVHAEQQEVRVVFMDQGIGIPRHLPRKHTMEHIRAMLSLLPGFEPDDAQMIRASMLVGRTSTGLTNRGKGMKQLRKILEEAGAGKLRILSNAGEYEYTGSRAERLTNYSDSIRGTLIEWRVPLLALDLLSNEVQP